MNLTGTVRIDKRTKNLVRRIQPGEIAIIVHEDLDAVAAENLVEKQVAAVINCCRSITGKYVNRGPYVLLDAKISLIDDVGADVLNHIYEGNRIEIRNNHIYLNGKLIATGILQSYELLNHQNQIARENLEQQIEQFADNTLRYMRKEKSLLYGDLKTKELPVDMAGKHVLVVVRGADYKKDLLALQNYTREKRPVMIGVDGGADALTEHGYKPDIVVGDMDSVGDSTLRSGACLVVHAYEGGEAPGANRLKEMGLTYHTLCAPGTSEDLALLLAHERGADIIVIVGSHFSMDEFLSKGRSGMASTFLTRLRVGSILVDAKGVSKLYESSVPPMLLVYLIIAAIVPIIAIIAVSPLAQQFVRLFRLLFNF
ncbi:MAG: putative cytokinetic ring protein SteA [bacterium]